MKGMAGPAAGAEGPLPKEYMDQYGQVCDKVTSWETTLLDGQVSVWQPLTHDTPRDSLIRGWAVVYICPIYGK